MNASLLFSHCFGAFYKLSTRLSAELSTILGSRLNSRLSSRLDSLWPRRCLLCHQIVEPAVHHLPIHHLPICHCCYHDLPVFTGAYCNNLRLKPSIARGLKNPQFDQLVCLAAYQWPFNQWISALKFRRHVNLASTLGKLLSIHISNHLTTEELPEVLIPLPLYKWRRFNRGFNQADLIAKSLSKSLSIPIDYDALTRIKATKAQSGLGKLARKQNVKGAFEYKATQPYQHVAIIDDVITTGATVNQVCELLTQAGVAHISIWCICATPIE